MRIVLDTNVVVSALLFSGPTGEIMEIWKSGKIVFLLSTPVLEEWVRVLSYPKFGLSDSEIHYLIEEEILPYVEMVRLHPLKIPRLMDQTDEKFLHLALCGQARYLVSGDLDLLSLKKIQKIPILTPGEFLTIFKKR